MTIYCAATADAGIPANLMGVVGTLNPITTYGARTGVKSWQLPYNTSIYIPTPRQAEIYVKVAFYAPGAACSPSVAVRVPSGNAYGNVTLNFSYNTGIISAITEPISISKPVVGTAACLLTGRWQLFEAYFKNDPTNGRIVVKCDGSTVIDYTGDTYNENYSGNDKWDSVRIGEGLGVQNGMPLDDLVVRDDAWPGQGGLYARRPNASGTYSGWTPSAGTALDCINDDPVDMTDYLAAPATPANVKHSFGVENTPANLSLSDIQFVEALAYGSLDAAGLGLLRNFLLSNGQVANGATRSFANAPANAAVLQDFFLTNPDGNVAWTQAALDALEQGIETLGQG